MLLYCGQTVGWIKMKVDKGEGLSPGHIVLDGDPAHKGHSPPIFCACLLWPNGWMDQDATWYGGKPWPRRNCVRQLQLPLKRGTAPPPTFQPMSIVAKGLDGSRCHLVQRYTCTGHIVLDGDPAPPKKGHSSPPLFGPYLLWPNGHPSQLLLSTCFDRPQ